MTTDYYKRFLHLGVQATCPGCGTTLRLHEFRKWWGSKHLLRTLCIRCEPERALEDMTPEERTLAVDNERPYATPTRVNRLNKVEAAQKKRRRVMGAKRRHSAARTQAWAPLMHKLKMDLDWCRKGKLALYITPERLTFFEAYEAALTDAVLVAKDLRTRATSTTQLPPLTKLLYPETCRALARLYAACVNSRGRALSRDPLFLQINEDMVSSLKGEK
jgi:hypothetical protein